MENLRSKILFAFTLELVIFWMTIVFHDFFGAQLFTIWYVWYALIVIINSTCIYLLIKFKPNHYPLFIFIGIVITVIPLLLYYAISHIRMC